MRKIFALATLAAFLFTITSCSSVESDAKKLAELQCKAMKNPTDAATIQKESEELSEKLKNKYSSEGDQKKFAEAYLKAMAECK